MFRAHGQKQIAMAASVVTEDKIVARDHMAGAESLDQGIGDEIFRLQLGKGFVESLHDQHINTQIFDQLSLGAERRQPERRLVGGEQSAGTGLERQHRPRPA